MSLAPPMVYSDSRRRDIERWGNSPMDVSGRLPQNVSGPSIRGGSTKVHRPIPQAILLVAALVTGCVGDPISGGPETGTGVDGGLDGAADGWDGDVLDGDQLLDSDLEADGGGDGDVDADLDVEDDRPCPANGNGVLEASEVVISYDTVLRYRAPSKGRTVPVDLAGTVEEGERVWHFEGEAADERIVEEGVRSPEGSWVADEFPTATHLTPMSEDLGTSGVFRLDDEGLWLLGVVSDGGQGTLISYDPEIAVVRFPLTEGDEWTVTSRGVGRMSWVPYWDEEEYTFTVDAAGTAVVPAGRFPVLRLRSELIQTVGVIQTRRIAYGFLCECWGKVANVVSREGERELEFSQASDYRRLTFE